jgi:thioredoxin 2
MDTTSLTVTVPCQFCGTHNRVAMADVRSRPRCRNADCARPILLDRPLPLHDDDFAAVIAAAEVPVLVDFYADWCGPCKAMAPVLDEVAGERAGALLVAKVNTDLAPKTAEAFAIRSIPTLMLFRGGQQVAQRLGAVPKRELAAMLDGEPAAA